MGALWGKYKKAIVSMLLLGLPLLFFYVNAKKVQELNFFDRFVLQISSPIQEATRWAVDGVYDLWEDYVYLREQNKTNNALRRELSRVRGVTARLPHVEAENERLKKMLDFHRVTPTIQKVAARVIARSTSPYFRVYRITIDAGGAAGIKKGMPVVTGDGVVGRVHSVFGGKADVMLLADPESSIDVVVQGTRATGFLRGRGESNNYRSRIEHLSLGDVVREGDVIVTSGIGEGNRFPKGLVVGNVSHVVRKQFAVSQEVDVIPAVAFSKVEEVFVLKSGAGVFVPPARPGVTPGLPEMPSTPPDVDGGDDAESIGSAPEPRQGGEELDETRTRGAKLVPMKPPPFSQPLAPPVTPPAPPPATLPGAANFPTVVPGSTPAPGTIVPGTTPAPGTAVPPSSGPGPKPADLPDSLIPEDQPRPKRRRRPVKKPAAAGAPATGAPAAPRTPATGGTRP